MFLGSYFTAINIYLVGVILVYTPWCFIVPWIRLAGMGDKWAADTRCIFERRNDIICGKALELITAIIWFEVHILWLLTPIIEFKMIVCTVIATHCWGILFRCTNSRSTTRPATN